MNIKYFLKDLIPNSLKLPSMYYYHKLKGSLDEELLYLKYLVDRGELAIDVGANYGEYTYALSKLCKQVIAFEPQQHCTEFIKEYKNRNIKVYNVGLSSSVGSMNLHIPIINGKPISGLASFSKPEENCETIQVPVYKLDDFEFQKVSFIKIDVEGHESAVIDGGRETILREKPIMLIEIEQRHLKEISMTDVFNQIIGLGYQGFFRYENKFFPLSEFSYETHQKPFLADFMCKDYINNFIFKPRINI